MKLEYLKEFVVLAKHLNFSTSAKHLYISQPVLSRHISLLENELGFKLFQRDTQNVTLTDVGFLFFQRVQVLIEDFEALCNEMLIKEHGFYKELRIGLPYYTMDYYTRQIPFLLAKEHPGIILTYLTGHPDQLIEALKNDEVNLLIAANLSRQYTENFEFYDLFDEPLAVLLPESHPLAKQNVVTLPDLAGETFLCVECKTFTNSWEYLRDLCLKNGYEPRGPVKFNQIEPVVIAIQHNQGIFVDGQNLFNLHQDGVTPVPLVGEGCFRRVSIVYKRENRNKAVSILINMLKKAVSPQIPAP